MGDNPPPHLPARGGPRYLPREEKRLAGREERKRGKKNTNQKKTSQTLGREEGASEREAREKTRPKAWGERDEALQKKGEAGEG